MVNPKLHVWCFRVAPPGPSPSRASEGRAEEGAGGRLESVGFSRGLSAAAESAFPEGAMASILRDAFGGKLCSALITVRGLASRAESNRNVGSLDLYDWCFRLARQTPSLQLWAARKEIK